MRKVFIILAAFTLFADISNAVNSESWYPLTSNTPKDVEWTVISQSDTLMEIRLETPGFYYRFEGSEARLRIGLNPAIADSGIPEVPMIGTVVGLPSCSNVSVEVIEEAVEVIDDWYQLYPRPALRVEQLPNGSEVVVEHYYKNETAYQTPSYSPLSAQPPAFPVE